MDVRQKLEKLKIEKRAYIDGTYVGAQKNKVIEKTSSIDGTDLSGIAACDEEDVNKAVEAADRAYRSGFWANRPPAERKAVILKLADLMEEHREELALLDTCETGRAYQNYYEDSIPKAIEAVRYFAESIDKYYDAAIPPRGSELGAVFRVPLGVVGLITPWNDPMVVAAWKYAPALLMGNSVVLKPAEQSSFSAIRLAELTRQAGVPDGVFNVVPGYGEIAGKALAMHKKVRGIYFTGSSIVGKQILQYSGLSNMKKVGLECGGKGPFIVTAKCKDILGAAKVLAKNIFYNQGQICSAPSRAIVEKAVAAEFIDALKKECEDYVPGDPFDMGNKVGCVVSRRQYDRVQNYINMAGQAGLTIYQAKNEKEHDPNALCIQPTIILGASNQDVVAREEIFGPVVTVLEVNNAEEAVRVANDSDYGLAGAVWTDDIHEACHIAKCLELGLVHINSYGDDDNSAPFGGVKESGLGKDKSVYAFDEYSDLKSVWISF